MPRRGPLLTGRRDALRGAPRVVTSVGRYSPRDAFKAKRPPTPVELAAAYRNAVYTLANINATAFSTQTLRLYAVTDRRKGHRDPRCRVKSIDRRREKHLWQNPGVRKRLAGADAVDEVTDHPLLDLLDDVNPWFSRTMLLETTMLSSEIDGRWFWYWVPGAGGLPAQVWPLPPWMVAVLPDYVGTEVVDKYLFLSGGGPADLAKEQMLFGREPSLFDFYTEGLSWVRANYEHAQAYDKNIDYRESVLSNRGRPDAMLIPKEESGLVTVDADAVQRIQAEYQMSYTGGQAARLWVPPGGMELVPLTWSPQDMGELALSQSVLHDLARAAGVPIPLVDGSSANRANMDAALLQHARFCVKPRCLKFEEYINSNFVPLWDDRLFLAFDDPVPADVAMQKETLVAYVGAGILSANEARTELGHDPVPGGDLPLVDPAKVPIGQGGKPAEGEGEPGGGQADDTGANPEDDADAETEGQDEAFEEGDDVESGTAGKAMADADCGCHDKSAGGDWRDDPDGLSAFETDLALFIKRYNPTPRQIAAFSKAYKPCRDARGRFTACGSGGGAKPAKPAKPGAAGGGSSGGEKPGKPAAGKPPEKPAEKPPGKPEKPAEKPPEKPPEKPAEKPTKPAKKPVEGRDFDGKSDDEIGAYHDSMSREWNSKLSPREEEAIHTYTTESYQTINGCARGRTPCTAKDRVTAAAVDDSIKKSKLKEPVTVYRGIDDLEAMGIDPKNPAGTVLKDKGFMSTSLDKKISDEFTGAGGKGAILKITAKAGTKAASMAGLSKYPREAEVLFPRNTKVKITGHSRDAEGRLILHAEVA